MAASHVLGYAAYLLSIDSTLNPAAVASTIKSNALQNVLSGIREFANIYQCRMKLIISLNSGRNHQCLAQQRPLLKIVCSWWGSGGLQLGQPGNALTLSTYLSALFQDFGCRVLLR